AGEAVTQHVEDPLVALREHLRATVAPIDSLPPFIGGAIGYAGYDVVRYTEHLPDAPADDRELPDLDFSFYHSLCIFDHVSKTITVVTLAKGIGADPRESYAEAVRRLDEITQRLAAPPRLGISELVETLPTGETGDRSEERRVG